MLKGMLLARPVRARALQTSAITLAIMAAGPAFGQCSPDPAPVNGTTICSGTDSNGLNVTTSGTTVNVLAGATVSGSGAPAIAVQIAPTANFYYAYTTLSVAGRVDGGAGAGARLLWQPAASGFASFESRLTMTVTAGGVVTGNNGIVVGQSASGFGNAYVTLDNAGTITGTGGIALLSTTPAYAGFSSIINRAGGVIGAISAPIGTVNNAGTIDGGSRSAIDWGTVSGPVYGDVTNSGTITAASSAATLVNVPGGRTITNSGSIANTGTGAAITGDNLTLTNAAGGSVASTGTTAIRANTFINLTNRGTIDGDVVTAAAPTYTTGSRIDSSAGTINGGVLFGAGDDTLVADYADGQIVTGITGTIDGGAGTDMLRIGLTRNATIAAAIALPTNFERLTLAPNSGVTATLADGFGGPIRIAGSGTITNRTTLSDATQVVTSDFGSNGSPTFINAGTLRTITAGIAGTYALNLSSITRFENSGSVDAAGNGVSFGSQGAFVNSGTITAAGTAVSVFSSSFANSGTILSTGGVGATLSGSYGSNWTNSGRIEGAVGGVRLSSDFANTGTITSAGTGVILDAYGIINNRAGGTISGGTRAIGPQSSNSYVFGATVANAGTISGDVALTGQSFGSTSSYNRYFALPGGVLNGNLTLASSDMLVTELVNTGTGAFAGITGTVSATNAALLYRVRSDASATNAVPAGFSSIGYDLFDKATLTLTGPASTRPLTLAGQGTVDLTADIATTTQPAIGTTSTQVAPGESYLQNALTITSRGTLTLTRADRSSYPYAVVALGSGDSFVNAGTIVARDQAATTFSPITAIGGGGAVTNSGTITLDGTIGVQGAQSITNTGTITQVVGGRAATGIRAGYGTTSLTNSGTIDVAGNAVFGDYYGLTITNSGRISSSTTTAIALASYGSGTISNLTGGTITGGAGQAIRMAGGTVTNAGTITGSVDLGYSDYGRSYAQAVYTANGGTIAGDLRFGDGDDIFVAMDDIAGVSGTIDGGAGNDTYVHARSTTGTVTLGALTATGFEREGVRALGSTTVATINAAAPVAGDLFVSGDGSIVNGATLNGAVRTGSVYNDPTVGTATLAAFTNNATIAGGFSGTVGSFTNSGTIGSATLTAPAVTLYDSASFTNSGTITTTTQNDALYVSGQRSTTIANSGTIKGGGVSAFLYAYAPNDGAAPDPLVLTTTNSGTITGSRRGMSLRASTFTAGGAATVTVANTGTIEATGQDGVGISLSASGIVGSTSGQTAITVNNAGTIRANAGGSPIPADPYAGASVIFGSTPAIAVSYGARAIDNTQIGNASGGVIEASGTLSAAIMGYGALDLTNAGTIRGGAGTTLSRTDSLATYIGSTYLAGAVQTIGAADDRIVNTGTITGSIALGAGNDRIENYGRIEGDVFLGLGDDTFLQRAGATLVGTVDGGAGTDSLIVDATGGGTVNGSQFVNFERFSQIGQGVVTYAGSFAFDTIGVSGGTVTVAAGQTLASTGETTVTGSDAAETLVNNGTILGAVALGGGDDSFVEGAGSRVAGGVDGGAGSDLYTVALVGNRSGIGQRSGFERLAVTGSGTLSLTLDQRFDTVSLTNTGLNLALAGQTVGSVTGSDGNEMLAVDGDIAVVSLGAGDDTLALGTTRATGRYLGGAGNDTLRFTATGPVVLGGSATGFEQVALAGNVLAVTGTLGSAGAALSFGAGDQQLTVADGGTLAGAIDLGAGNDSFRLTANATLNGTVSGGAGTDIATVELTGNRTLAATTLRDFETLATEGSGTLSLAGTQSYGQIVASGDLAVAAGNSLTATQVRFGAGNNRFTVAGQFAGAVDGGAGSDTIAVSGGSATAPVAFSTIANVEAFGMTGGYATIANSGTLGAIDLTGGRLVGLAGSTITAPRIAVGQRATFGSAGTVIGNIAVAGTLSPGASPGTMTVTGNVALAGTSLSLFELTPTVSDKLVVAGTLSIATGATLQIVSTGTLRPGTSYDLITASGGISGSFTTVQKPDNVFGFIVQRADRLQLIGQFLGDAGFSPQVGRSIAYANATLAVQPATSTLFAALPALLTSSGASNAQAFARLTPEAYASASQLGIDNALTLAQTARGPAIATDREDVGLFTFAQTLGQWHTLGGDPATGTATARSQGYGMLGGLGIGDRSWAVGAFAGYLNSRQQIAALGTRTRTNGFVAGVHGRYAADNGFGFSASILYDGGDARTERALPGTASATGATGRYDLHSWVSDVSVSYATDMAGDWTLEPKLGVTYVRTTRDGLGEAGGSPFALTVARDRHAAGFADAGVSLGRSDALDAPFRPFVALGARYQIEGRRTDASGGYAGGGLGLSALGAGRAELVGTAAGGVAYRFANGIDLFTAASAQTGRDDHQETITTGVRLRF
ncbi:autotransporter outer membrane beta-barrel domain-containing protein [Sphingomonas mollis]|uniref:Autotransporter outer membrane beta-barrel domain-containing protein n=1 Tax=Sphingomonas mollis TaxID=2795726 RepID=A0ABS0XT70_9SPHN|nr:autotransporter outer membrane beta-barrel domain-containing protein [Sphingomonas sp. BT553]MBJ6123254.1 autotransporter outer membrane beta-barrel domain-containing protein [Sphingomonas sp. BT553]